MFNNALRNTVLRGLKKEDTQELLNFINDPSNSSIAVRNEMISCIPFISIEAWRAAFDRQPAMNPWHLAQILLDASPLKKDIQKLMDEFEMDPYFKTLVMNAQNGGFTSQNLLEADLSMLGLVKQRVRNSLAAKELFENSETSVSELLEINGIDEIEPDVFLLAELSNLKDDHIEAASLLDDCGLGIDDEQICEALRQIALAERDANECNEPHGAPLQSIELIAGNPEHLGNSLARAYLSEKSLGFWESDLFPSIIVRSQLSLIHNIGLAVNPLISVQPNPASEVVRFICTLPEGVENAEIRLYDNQMKLFHVFNTGSSLSIHELDLIKLSSGIYFFELYANNIQLDSGKWQVIH